MTIQRMDHVGIVVDDLASAKAFFVELGLKLQGEGTVGGGWVDRVVGLEGVRVEYAMMDTPGRPRTARADQVPRPVGRRRRPARARRTPLASAISHSQSTTSTPSSPACEPTARSSLARWRTTRT